MQYTNYEVSPLPSFSHFLGPKCSPQFSTTSLLLPYRATKRLTQPRNIIRFTSFLFKNVTKYTFLHVTQESDHTLCTTIPINQHSLEFSAVWVSFITEVLEKARQLTGCDSNSTALADGHAIGNNTTCYNIRYPRCVCPVYIVTTFSIHCFLNDNVVIFKRHWGIFY